MTDDQRDTSGSTPLGAVLGTLSRLLEQLDDADLDSNERRSGTLDRGDLTLEYTVTIGSIDPAGESRPTRQCRDRETAAESNGHGCRVRVNDEESEIVVVADLPSASADDIEVGTPDDDTLQIRVDGDVLESVPVDWDDTTVSEVTFTNQVLEVHATPPDSSSSGETDR